MEQLNQNQEYENWRAPDASSASDIVVENEGAAESESELYEVEPFFEETQKKNVEQRMEEVKAIYKSGKVDIANGTNLAGMLNHITEQQRFINDEDIITFATSLQTFLSGFFFQDCSDVEWIADTILGKRNVVGHGSLEQRLNELNRPELYIDILVKLFRHKTSNGRVLKKDLRREVADKFCTLFESTYAEFPEKYVCPHPGHKERLEVFLRTRPERASDFIGVVEKALLEPADEPSGKGKPDIDPYLLSTLALSKEPAIDRAMDKYFASLGLDWQKLHQLWDTTKRDHGEVMFCNLNNIMELEAVQPGASAKLAKEQKIEFFGRYDVKMLKRQAEIIDTDIPYGVLIFPKADYNGAFYGMGPMLNQLQGDLEKMHLNIRIVEAGGKFSAGKRLLELNERYGKNNKISFLLLGGHGSANSVQLGEERDKESLQKESWFQKLTPSDQQEYLNNPQLSSADLHGAWLGKVRSFFNKHIPMVFISCSTGTDGGIAEQTASLANLHATAPTIPTSVRRIKPVRVGQLLRKRLGFEVDYTDKGIAAEYGK